MRLFEHGWLIDWYDWKAADPFAAFCMFGSNRSTIRFRALFMD
jgi:hypothetical protein